MVISEPEINIIQIDAESDFIILGSDGIFDKLTSEEVAETFWKSARQTKNVNIHEISCEGIESILMESFNRQSIDNLTLIVIGLNGLKE